MTVITWFSFFYARICKIGFVSQCYKTVVVKGDSFGELLKCYVMSTLFCHREMRGFPFPFNLNLIEPRLCLLESMEPKNQYQTHIRKKQMRLANYLPNREVVYLKVTQSCLTLCDPMDCSLSGSSVHGILQARVLEWVAFSFSRGSSWPKDQIQHCRQIL